MAQWKRAGPITQRSEDQNLALLNYCLFIFKCKNSLNDRKRFYFLFVLLHISFLFIFVSLNDLTTPIVNKNFLKHKNILRPLF